MPDYKPIVYNLNPYIKASHNCYSYVLDDIEHNIARQCWQTAGNDIKSDCRKFKAQPGYYSGHPRDLLTDCSKVRERVIDDNPEIKIIDKETDTCPKGFYKAAFGVNSNYDENNNSLTYHFWRKDDNTNMWSHKNGSLDATNLDSSGNEIPILSQANLRYDVCEFMCIPRIGDKNTHFDVLKK